jgi:ABC-type sugar transport system ATPase subunit
VLETHRLTRRGAFTDVSLRVGRGEIVGLVGIAGSGCSEVLRAIFGAEPPDSGDMVLDCEPVVVRRPKDAARHGIVLLPERRIEQGLVMRRPVRENVSLAALRTISTGAVVRRRDETSLVRGLATLLQIRAPSIEARASTLSGGNQQKVVLAKWLVRPPKVLLADQPTRGVDVGAKLQIHAVLADLAARGLAVLFIPSDIDEAVGVAHRLLVFRGGRIVDELDGATATGDVVMASMFGGPTEARAG